MSSAGAVTLTCITACLIMSGLGVLNFVWLIGPAAARR